MDSDPEKSENSDEESCNFNENISEVSYTEYDDNDTLDLMKQRLRHPKKINLMREVFSSARQFQKSRNEAKKTTGLAWTDKDAVTGKKKGFGAWIGTIDSNNFDTEISYDGLGQNGPIKAPDPFHGTYTEKKDPSYGLQQGLFTSNIE